MGPLPNIPDSFFRVVFALAVTGAFALVAALICGLVWLVMHVRFV